MATWWDINLSRSPENSAKYWTNPCWFCHIFKYTRSNFIFRISSQIGCRHHNNRRRSL